ncbi:hypothetical protein C8J55DRAFT_489404 [Lentinula edodes]|uniref:Uncharacterized protein n=1 Tax=Lentinula lateritia TaxID=40482 RepID=A0A9W9ACR9_9AGAR|nr:hypothetical protein C8J55DRAFT_489404 [Lentinula edodes]
MPVVAYPLPISSIPSVPSTPTREKRKPAAHDPTSPSPLKKVKAAPSLIVIDGVSYIRQPVVSSLPSTSTPDSNHHADLGPSDIDDLFLSSSPSNASHTPTARTVAPNEEQDFSQFDDLDLDLPDDLSGIPALSAPYGTSPSGNHTPVHTFSPSIPVRDLRRSVRTPQGSSIRKAAIDAALSSPSLSGSAMRKAAIDAALASPSTARSSSHVKQPSLLEQIDAIATSTYPNPTMTSPSHTSMWDAHNVATPRPLFNDSGLGSKGCMQMDFIDPFLSHEYYNVQNLCKPVLFSTTSVLPPPEDFDFLPFREIYSILPPAEKLSLFRVINFSHLGSFVNPSRAKYSLVSAFNSAKNTTSLFPSGGGNASRYNSIFLTSGVVEQSSIYNVVPINLSGGGSRVVRELHLKPFLQEFQILCGFFARALSFDTIAMQATRGVITFTTSQYFPEWQRTKVDPHTYAPLIKSNHPPRPPAMSPSDPRLTPYAHFTQPTSFAQESA